MTAAASTTIAGAPPTGGRELVALVAGAVLGVFCGLGLAALIGLGFAHKIGEADARVNICEGHRIAAEGRYNYVNARLEGAINDLDKCERRTP